MTYTPASHASPSTGLGRQTSRAASLAALLLLASGAIEPRPALGQSHFSRDARGAELHRPAYRSDSRHAFGITWVDVDGDTWPDLITAAGIEHHIQLFINQHDGTFRHAGHLLPPMTQQERTGIYAADIDNDGDQDLLIQVDAEEMNVPGPNSGGAPPSLLLRNLLSENGGVISFPLFEEVGAERGVDSRGRDYSASFLDYDRDGWLDLYVGRFVHSNVADPVNQDVLYRNDGTGHFVDATVAAGVDLSGDPTQLSAALALIGAHLDEDLNPDVFVAGNMFRAETALDLLWLNQGDGGFINGTSLSTGFGDDVQSPMGVDTADIDQDGHWDLVMSDIHRTRYDQPPLGNVLYLGQGGGLFSDSVAVEWGINPGFTAWGVNFFDIDQDTYDDLFMAVVDVNRYYINQGGAGFEEHRLGTQNEPRGSAVADYDRDGDLDLAVIGEGSELELWRNHGADGHGIVLTFRGVASNRDGIGVLVKATLGETVLMRQLKGGTSVHSQDEKLVHFGLGDATVIDALEVSWPSGLIETRLNVPADQRLHWVEGSVGDPDGDGDVGAADNCPWTPNADQADSEGDGIGDACDDCPAVAGDDDDGDGLCPDVDPCPLDPNDDVDGDGHCGPVDNCPTDGNADQLDTDGDGYGDACDPCPLDEHNDWERDGFCANEDLCPDQVNNDDRDGDGLCTWIDNCREVANPDQLDRDRDGVGDACDSCDDDDDRDDDGLCSKDDNCFRIANNDQADADFDGLGDVCDPCPADPTNKCEPAVADPPADPVVQDGGPPATVGDGDGDGDGEGGVGNEPVPDAGAPAEPDEGGDSGDPPPPSPNDADGPDRSEDGDDSGGSSCHAANTGAPRDAPATWVLLPLAGLLLRRRRRSA